MRASSSMLLVLTMAVSLIAAEDNSLDPIVGDWVSPDGKSRQQIEPGLDGTWLTTRMWFKTQDDWKLVAQGGIYRKPGEEGWISVSRSIDMEGIVLFESTMIPGADTLRMRGQAFRSDGTVMETAEEWRFPDTDRIDYTVFTITESGRQPLFEGAWVRRGTQK